MFLPLPRNGGEVWGEGVSPCHRDVPPHPRPLSPEGERGHHVARPIEPRAALAPRACPGLLCRTLSACHWRASPALGRTARSSGFCTLKACYRIAQGKRAQRAPPWVESAAHNLVSPL